MFKVDWNHHRRSWIMYWIATVEKSRYLHILMMESNEVAYDVQTKTFQPLRTLVDERNDGRRRTNYRYIGPLLGEYVRGLVIMQRLWGLVT